MSVSGFTDHSLLVQGAICAEVLQTTYTVGYYLIGNAFGLYLAYDCLYRARIEKEPAATRALLWKRMVRCRSRPRATRTACLLVVRTRLLETR